MHKGYSSPFVCLYVCLLPRNLLHTSFKRQKHDIIGFFMVFQGFRRVALAETLRSKFWHHLPIIAAFLAS